MKTIAEATVALQDRLGIKEEDVGQLVALRDAELRKEGDGAVAGERAVDDGLSLEKEVVVTVLRHSSVVFAAEERERRETVRWVFAASCAFSFSQRLVLCTVVRS